MQRDERPLLGLKVGDLMDVGFARGRHMAGRKPSRAERPHVPVGLEFVHNLTAGAVEDLEGAGRAGVIMDGTALTGQPADDQDLVPRAAADEIALVASGVEGDEIPHSVRHELELPEPRAQFLQISPARAGLEAGDDGPEPYGDTASRHICQSVPAISRDWMMTWAPVMKATERGGTDRVSQTLEPMTEPAPMRVSPPRIVAWA